MVANVHQDPGAEGRHTFDMVYLVGVTGFISALAILPIVKHAVHHLQIIDFCNGSAKRPTHSFVIPAAFFILMLVFTIMFRERFIQFFELIYTQGGN